MKSGLTISAIGHAAFLAWGIISFSATPLKTEPTESLPVDIISANDFSAMTSGVKNAKKVETPKPVVEKVAPKNEIKDTTPKVAEKKPEIQASEEAPPPPPVPTPKPKVAEAKPPEAKPEPKPEKKPDPIAEAIKQEKPDEKKPEKEAAAQKPTPEVPTPQKRPPRPEATKPEPKFDATKVAALLDKRAPQREASAGDVINTQPSLGTPRGAAAQLSQTELDALRARLRDCWMPPAGVSNAEDLQIVTSISFRQDGSLSSDPKVSNRSSHPAFRIASESVLRAIRRCAPYTFLPVAKYDAWKDVEVTFSPKDLF